MGIRAIAVIGAIALSACTGLSKDRIRYGGGDYWQLTGEPLRLAIEGKQLTFPDDAHAPYASSARCHRFHVNGSYIRCRHRAPLYGSYAISHDRVCATPEPADPAPDLTSCWALYSSSRGGYLLRPLLPTPAPAEPVILLSLPELNRR